jgi:hypothetical protein
VLEGIADHLPDALRYRRQYLWVNVVAQLLPQQMGERLLPAGVRGALEWDDDTRCVKRGLCLEQGRAPGF